MGGLANIHPLEGGHAGSAVMTDDEGLGNAASIFVAVPFLRAPRVVVMQLGKVMNAYH